MSSAASGMSLIDSALALFLVSAVSAATAQTLAAAGAVVAVGERRDAVIDVARQSFERLRADPCAPDPPCPGGYRCSVTRSPLAGGIVVVSGRFDADAGDSGTSPLRQLNWQTAIDTSGCG